MPKSKKIVKVKQIRGPRKSFVASEVRGAPSKGAMVPYVPKTKSFVTQAPSATELAQQKYRGRAEFHAKREQLGRVKAPKLPPAPKAPKKAKPSLRQRVQARAEAKKTAQQSKFQAAGRLGKVKIAVGRGVRGAIKSPGVATGAYFAGAVSAGKPVKGAALDIGIGAGVGRAIQWAVPKLISKVAVPVAIAATAYDVQKAAKRVKPAIQAAKHVKKQARGAARRGFGVTRRPVALGMITGKPGIKIRETEKTRAATRRYEQRARRGF